MGVARLAILALAAVAAGLAAFLVQGLIGRGDKKVEVKNDLTVTQVLVAAKDLSIGHQIAAADLRWQAWPEAALTAGYIVKTSTPQALESSMGSIVRQAMLSGEPVTSGKIIQVENASFMAAMLSPGMRAVSVKISAETGAGGFILPNDRVDVILTQDATSDGGQNSEHVSRTILSNVRVLAIDQTYREEGENRVVVGKTATVELTPPEAEVLAQSEASGTVSLALRSLADFKAQAPSTPSARGSSVTVVRYGTASRVSVTELSAAKDSSKPAAKEPAHEAAQ